MEVGVINRYENKVNLAPIDSLFKFKYDIE